MALCDLYQDNVEAKLATLNQIDQHKKHQKVKTYWGDENRWREMLEEVASDVVFISTNWTNHAPMAIASMENGAHAFVEVPLATSMEELMGNCQHFRKDTEALYDA